MIERFASWATRWTGSTTAFVLSAAFVVVWLVSGPLFHWSDTWQLVANTITTIITFLMVFLIQRTQNKDSRALQLKLNEVVAAMEGASNRLISIEDLSEGELDTLHKHYAKLAEMAKEHRLTDSHSIEEAEARHAYKRERRKERRRVK